MVPFWFTTPTLYLHLHHIPLALPSLLVPSLVYLLFGLFSTCLITCFCTHCSHSICIPIPSTRSRSTTVIQRFLPVTILPLLSIPSSNPASCLFSVSASFTPGAALVRQPLTTTACHRYLLLRSPTPLLATSPASTLPPVLHLSYTLRLPYTSDRALQRTRLLRRFPVYLHHRAAFSRRHRGRSPLAAIVQTSPCADVDAHAAQGGV